MARRIMTEFSVRMVKRNGVHYKFTRDANPSYGYVNLTAWKWSGWHWQLLHDIELH